MFATTEAEVKQDLLIRILEKRLRECKKLTFRYINVFLQQSIFYATTRHSMYHMKWLKSVYTAFRCGIANTNGEIDEFVEKKVTTTTV